MQSDFRSDEIQLTPTEAEEVLRRFRAEEEELQRRMEARATNPTIADLAEGLGVPAERIARLLSEVRTQPAPLQSAAKGSITQEKAQNDHKTAWIVGGIAFIVLILAMLIAFVTSEGTKRAVPAPTAPFSQSGGSTTPAPEATAPTQSEN